MAAIFPSLHSGAVAQYPASIMTGQSTQVVRFLDGTDQRYVQQGRFLRSWQIKLNLLNETEIAQIEAFFISQQGDYSSFSFPDPFSGAVVANCRFASSGLSSQYVDVDSASTSVWVIETNG